MGINNHLAKKVFYKGVCLCLIAFVMSSCHRRIHVSKQSKAVCDSSLLDISVPFGVKPYNLMQEGNADSIVSFATMTSVDDLIEFYRVEMERLGWQQLKFFGSQQEALLLYDKPYKLCIISLRLVKKECIVTIYSGTN